MYLLVKKHFILLDVVFGDFELLIRADKLGVIIDGTVHLRSFTLLV